jgi:hypothetical protein
LKDLEKLSDPIVLKNLDLDKLQAAVEQLADLQNNLQSGNESLGATLNEFTKDRANLGDADLYEIQEKKAGEMKFIDEGIKESQLIVADLKSLLEGSNDTGMINQLKDLES